MPSLWRTLCPLLLLLAYTSADSLDCSLIRIKQQSFNLKKLGGPKTVHRIRWEPPSVENYTFTVDICNPLKKSKDSKKKEECPTGTRICAKEWDYRPGEKGFLKEVIPITGVFPLSHGKGMNPQFHRLKDSAENSDGKEGLVVELEGPKYSGTKQKAIIEFLCDKSVRGDEGFEDEEPAMLDASGYGRMARRKDDKDDEDEDDDKPDLPNPDKNKNLKFRSYELEGDTKVLRLRWKTKFACEGAADSEDPDDKKSNGSGGWGFFTWFIICLFLTAASYIIFGSWLNYNRYGARGWDLIPHGDTIRDIPYIIKDWGSGVTERLKGGGSRGGYSAV